MRPLPICLIHSRRASLVQRISALLEPCAEAVASEKTEDLERHLEQHGPAALFIDALHAELEWLVDELREGYPDCPLVILGEEGSDPVLALESKHDFLLESAHSSVKRLQRAFVVAHQQIEAVTSYKSASEQANQPSLANSQIEPSRQDRHQIKNLLRVFTEFHDESTLLEKSLEWIREWHGLANAGVFLFDPECQQYRVKHSFKSNSDLDELAFEKDHPFVSQLNQRPFIIHERTVHRVPPYARRHSVQMLQRCLAQAIFPLMGRQGLLGWLFVGPGALGDLPSEDLEELHAVIDHLAVLLERVSEQYQAQHQSAAFQSILANLEAGIVTFNTQLEVTWLNALASEILSKSTTSVIGHPCEVLGSQLAHLVRSASTDARQRVSGTWQPACSTKEYLINIHPLDGHASSNGFYALLQDITSDLILNSRDQTPIQTEEADHIGSNICTEIRDPLVAIKTFVQLLPERSADPEFCHHFARVISGSVDRLESLSQELEQAVYKRTTAILPTRGFPIFEIVEDVFRQLGQTLHQEQLLGARNVALRWSVANRQTLLERLASLANAERWNHSSAKQNLLVEWLDSSASDEVKISIQNVIQTPRGKRSSKRHTEKSSRLR